LECTTFVALSNIGGFPSFPLLTQQELVESIAEANRDKIGRGTDQHGKGGARQNRVGMSFKEDKIEMRRNPG
jgi:hypothetical protein